MKYTIDLQGLNGNQGNQPSIELPIGFEFFALLLKNSNATPITDLTEFKLNVNGENVMPLDGIEIDEINKFDGLTPFASNQILRLDFENQKFIDGKARQSTSINTGMPDPETKKVITSFSCSWKQASAGDWTIQAIVGDPDPIGPGAIKRYQKMTPDLSNGEKQITDMLYADAQHALLRRIFTRASSGTLSRLRLLVSKDLKPRFDRLQALNDQLLTDAGKVPGTYWDMVMDLTENNMPDYLNTLTSDFFDKASGVAIAKSLGFYITNSAQVAGTVIVESVGAPA